MQPGHVLVMPTQGLVLLRPLLMAVLQGLVAFPASQSSLMTGDVGLVPLDGRRILSAGPLEILCADALRREHPQE